MLRIESFRKGIALSSAYNVVAKILGFAANLAVAYYFGSQIRTDVYFFAFGTVTIASAFLTLLNGAVLIPETMRIAEQQGKPNSMSFANLFLYGYAALAIAASVPALLYPSEAFGFISQFDAEALRAHFDILRWSVPLLLLMVLSSLLTDILSSYRYFTAPMLFSMLNSILVLVAIVLFHGALDILSVLVGLTAAYVLQILVQVWLMKRNLEWEFRLVSLRVGSLVAKNILFSQAGGIATSLANYVPLYLLSGFSPGFVTALTYGQKMADLPTALVTTQASSVAGIRFNELMARGDWVGIDDVFARTVSMLIHLLVPVTVFLSLYGEVIMRILFLRGEFAEESVVTAATFLRILVWALPVIAINTMVARVNMASQRIRQAFWYQVTNNLLLVLCIYVAVRFWGPFGYPIGFVTMNVLSLGAMAIFVRIVLPDLHFVPVISAIGKALLVNAPIALIVFGWHSMASVPPILDIAFGGMIYLGLLIFINDRWRFNIDAADAVRAIFAKLKSQG